MSLVQRRTQTPTQHVSWLWLITGYALVFFIQNPDNVWHLPPYRRKYTELTSQSLWQQVYPALFMPQTVVSRWCIMTKQLLFKKINKRKTLLSFINNYSYMNHAFSCKKRSKKEIRLARRWCYTIKETEGSEQNQSLIFFGCHEVWAQATPSFGAKLCWYTLCTLF